MKLKLLFFFIIIISFTNITQIKLQFITVNGYGNNLYMDNLSLGTQFNNDVGVVSINNINPDTSYALGSNSFTLAPNVSFINSGRNNINTSFNVTLTVTPGVYSSTKTISSLNSGSTTEVNFDNLTITPGQPITLVVSSYLAGDENTANNVLNQFTHIFPGFQRNVLLEEWTSSTCGPCAANNPTVDAFIASKFDSLVPIKYHMNWPSPGNDPMYLYNPTQNNDRRYYYGINAVPTAIMDGLIYPSYPYSNPPSLPNAFGPRKLIGTPLKVTVIQTRISGDTIKADVTVNIASPLPAGNYYLRVHAVERGIHYASPPGTNGEKDFYDVFRKAFPTSLGTQIPTTVGSYVFTFKYKLDLQAWVDSMIYTSAFVQNDATKEVLNCGKSRNYLDIIPSQNIITEAIEKPIVADQLISGNEKIISSSLQDKMVNVFHYNLFEDKFPPAGWQVKNPDGGLTFEHFKGANGPMFGGQKSVTLQFYNYSATNQTDTLYTRIFNGLTASDTLKFNWAYAMYSTSYIDKLIVKVSIDGGLSYPYTIFDKYGTELATAPTTTNAFIPTDASQWKTFSFALNSIIPVELTFFSANSTDNKVELVWKTSTETNNRGFEVQRKERNDFITIGFVKGNGTTTLRQDYNFFDKNVNAGKYIYRLKQLDYDGTYTYSKEIEVDVKIVNQFYLEQNYPNPFNPRTKIKYQIVKMGLVTLKVFDILGNELKILVNETKDAGYYEADFDGSNLSSGIYFYELKSGEFTAIKKLVLMK